LCKVSQSIAQHVIHVQGHKVKYSNCNNSAADCPIALKFGTEFERGAEGLLHMLKVKGQSSRSGVKVHFKVTSLRKVSAGKRYNAATDRLSDFKLGMCDELKRIATARRWVASSCNAFAIATFSSFFFILYFLDQNTSLSSRGEAGQQMHTRGSVIGAATRIDSNISPTPPKILQGRSKVRFLALSFNSARLCAAVVWKTARYRRHF